MKGNINKPVETKESLIAIGLFLIVLVFFSGCSYDYVCVDNRLYERVDGVLIKVSHYGEKDCLGVSGKY